MVKRFLQSRRSGLYLAVVAEGEVGAGDSIQLRAQPEGTLTVSDIVDLYAEDSDNRDLLRRAVALPALPESWRDYFRGRLHEPDA
jgi:MOSC domain-containing protein YiiM